MHTDRYGLAFSSASEKAAAAYREGIDLMLCAYPGAEERLRAALAHDSEFALVHAALARQVQIYGRVAEAREAIARARMLAAHATPRERSHIAILGLAIDGEPAKALQALQQHLEAYPRDALPFSLALGAFGLYAFSGRADHDAARLALCRSMATHYGDDWWFLTHLGWSHVEAGELAAGARLIERALELKRDNAHAAHAYAHYFAEAGAGAEGTAFVEAWLPGYESGAMLHGHLQWHRALWRLDEGDVRGALELYAECFHPATNRAPPINVISDAASLLWRIALREKHEIDWRAVHAYGEQRFRAPAPHFIEWHLAMAAAGAGELARLDRRMKSMQESPAGAVLPAVCAAFAAFARQRCGEVVELLAPLTREFVRLGGSGAQRRVLFETLDAARGK